jgi:alpha 1,3-glucosidase
MIFSVVISLCVLISISLFCDRLTVIEKTAEFISVKAGANRVTVHAIPFRVDLYSDDQLVISANARGLMRFEHMRPKPEQ